MPRPNPPRAVSMERYLAQRIARERQERGWSYEVLATHMTQAGCPLDQSAIYKIERGDPPRRITVDELVGYCRSFGLTVSQMLDPSGEAEERLFSAANQARRAYREIWDWTVVLLRMGGQVEEAAAFAEREGLSDAEVVAPARRMAAKLAPERAVEEARIEYEMSSRPDGGEDEQVSQRVTGEGC